METWNTENYHEIHTGRATSQVTIHLPINWKTVTVHLTFESRQSWLVYQVFTPNHYPGDNYTDREIPLASGASWTPTVRWLDRNRIKFAMTNGSGQITGNLDYTIEVRG